MRLLAFVLSAPFIEVAALFVSIVWMLRKPRDKARPLLVIALTVNLFYDILLRIFMGAEGSLLPWKYDFVLLRLDAALGLPATRLAQPLQGAWRIPLATAYQLMVPMMICWFLVVRRPGLGGALVLAYVVELVTGPILYAIVPACGPAYAVGPGWMRAALPEPELMRLASIPNAFPSLHVATALVLVVFAPRRWSRLVAAVFFATTVMATISTGEHYVIDLLPGLAFGCFAAEVGFRHYVPTMANLGLAIAWSLVVRFEYGFLISHASVLRLFAILTALTALATVVHRWASRDQASGLAKSDGFREAAPELPTPVHTSTP